MARRRFFGLAATGLLAVAASLVAITGSALAAGPPDPDCTVVSCVEPANPSAHDDNGIAEIHEGTSGNEPDGWLEPIVCSFHIYFHFSDAGESGSWWIQSWPPTGTGATVLLGTYLSAANGEYRTPAWPGAYSLPNGHYRLTWQRPHHGDGHKTFWVYCTLQTPAPTATPTATPAPTATPTPFETFQGETATPSADPTTVPTGTPFESFQGETATPAATATPPPTSTGDGHRDGNAPLTGLLICLAFGALGLFAVDVQRRSIRR